MGFMEQQYCQCVCCLEKKHYEGCGICHLIHSYFLFELSHALPVYDAVCKRICLTLLRLPLLLRVFALLDSLSVCYSCILILYFVYDFNNNNNNNSWCVDVVQWSVELQGNSWTGYSIELTLLASVGGKFASWVLFSNVKHLKILLWNYKDIHVLQRVRWAKSLCLPVKWSLTMYIPAERCLGDECWTLKSRNSTNGSSSISIDGRVKSSWTVQYTIYYFLGKIIILAGLNTL